MGGLRPPTLTTPMTITEIQQKILTDDAFVLEEVKKLQYLYGLKDEIRYELSRHPDDYSESVAEHVYSMHIVSDYFLKLEDSDNQMNHLAIKTMITWHDMDELETGDKISWKKTPDDIANELTAWKSAVVKIPEILQTDVSILVEQYENKQTSEACFVKAVDKLEPLLHLFTPKGKKWIADSGLTFSLSEKVKVQHIKPFPFMNRFMVVLHSEMLKQGHFPR